MKKTKGKVKAAVKWLYGEKRVDVLDKMLVVFLLTEIVPLSAKSVELSNYTGEQKLLVRFQLPREHSLHIDDTAFNLTYRLNALNGHYEEGANCEKLLRGSNYTTCSNATFLSLSSMNIYEMMLDMTLHYPGSSVREEEWRIRVDLPRTNCPRPIRYLVAIPPCKSHVV